jgi:hypothetical protein
MIDDRFKSMDTAPTDSKIVLHLKQGSTLSTVICRYESEATPQGHHWVQVEGSPLLFTESEIVSWTNDDD